MAYNSSSLFDNRQQIVQSVALTRRGLLSHEPGNFPLEVYPDEW